jgi:hypothetical protein
MAVSADYVRRFVADSEDNNHLLDGLEFTDMRIELATDMAVSMYNVMPPISDVTDANIPNAILLYGILWQLYIGQSALAARNQMSYSDGGLTVPIEERYQFYIQLAGQYETTFRQAAKDYKINVNLNSGWGNVQSDYVTFPIW